MFRLNSTGKSFPGYAKGKGRHRRVILQITDSRGKVRRRRVRPDQVVDISC